MLQIPPYIISYLVLLKDPFLAPCFFLFYINGIPDRPDTKLGFFAGDCNPGQRLLPPDLPCRNFSHTSLLNQWFSKWRVCINLDQTKAILFTQCSYRRPSELRLFDHSVPWSRKAKYHGITFDQKLL
jgi:hypothetical protein